jgi:hypothetical protein
MSSNTKTLTIPITSLTVGLCFDVFKHTGYSGLSEFQQKNPDFKISFTVPVNTPSGGPLAGFRFSRHKKCLLVVHPDGLGNSGKVSNIFQLDGSKRPMYWNPTLQGWVASPDDINVMIRAGAKGTD